MTPNEIAEVAKNVGETTILSRTGGAPTLAVGMASILSAFLGGPTLMGIWYHFAILFEALFILTTVDAGTRVLRFMIQDLIGNAVPAFKETASWTNNLIGSGLSVALWGYFLIQWSNRSIWRYLDPVAAVWHRQPDACCDRADGMHGRAVQDETRAIRTGNDSACSLARRMYGDCRTGESVQSRSECRFR